MVKEVNEGAWRNISYKEFDGKQQNSFSRTSMHLTFTDYYVPMYDGNRGGFENQVNFLESVIAVYDSGEWIADVDILSALRNLSIRRLGDLMPCNHARGRKPPRSMIAVENWDEVLDRPAGNSVIQASGNWIARLAISAVLSQLSRVDGSMGTLVTGELETIDPKRLVTICPSYTCWECVTNGYSSHTYIY